MLNTSWTKTSNSRVEGWVLVWGGVKNLEGTERKHEASWLTCQWNQDQLQPAAAVDGDDGADGAELEFQHHPPPPHNQSLTVSYQISPKIFDYF